MSDLIEHSPVDGPADVVHPGDQLDCKPCRAALLTAFRASPDQVSEEETIHRLFPEQTHSTTADVYPYEDQPGGLWQASCACGWSREGQYARDGSGEIVAARLAETWASHHLNHPLEGTEDQ